MSENQGAVVLALHDVIRFRTKIVDSGSPGRVVEVVGDGPGAPYTVEFTPSHVPSATVRIGGLTNADVRGRSVS